MQVPSLLQGESLKRLLPGAAIGAVATLLSGLAGVAGRSVAPPTGWRKTGPSWRCSGVSAGVRRQIPRPTGRRGEDHRPFEGRSVETRGRVPQGVHNPPG